MNQIINGLEASEFKAKGFYTVEHIRDGKVIGNYKIPNGVTNVGKDKVLNVMFHSDTQITTWYLGLIDNSGFSAVAAADTAASHTGWNEFTNYSQATRVAWGPDAAASQSISNSTPATFDITGSGTIKGIFNISVNTKGGTTGTLWSTALFASNVAVNNGDQLKVTYTSSAT